MTTCPIKRAAHSRAKAEVQSRVRELKNSWWTERALEIQKLADSGDTRGFFSATKAVYGPSYLGLNPLRSKDVQELLKDNESINTRWKDHFQELLNRNSITDPDFISHIPKSPIREDMGEPPTMTEVQDTIRSLRNNKATGPDGIPAGILREGGPELLYHIQALHSRNWLFNLLRFKAKSKVSNTTIMERQYADDNAIAAHSAEDLQGILNAFAKAYRTLGLTLNITKTQGSVLGPILFNIYMIPLGDIIRKYNISFQCFADETQLYMPLSMTDPPDCCNLEACLAEIKQWMSLNFLRVNPEKTEMLIIGPASYQHLFKKTTITIDNRTITQSDTVTNLRVIFDQMLSFQKHIKNITRIAFFHLRNIAKIRPILSTGDAETIIHAFITSRLDYCDALFSGVPKSSIKRLQLVQNAARVLSRTRKCYHITPILANLHWLPVHLRCDLKVLLLTYKSLHGLAPSYLVDLVVPYVPSRNLRSQNASPRAQTMSRAFSIRAPELWNALPMDIRTATSVETFKTCLKTHFYDMAFN
ncbi:uncharacterized protein [Syngnathus scovelli]|uniref:uncharacterized protein n=1 Tax=Syngnathus scovelli TaxID=161590 RepID=UPI0035C9D483